MICDTLLLLKRLFSWLHIYVHCSYCKQGTVLNVFEAGKKESVKLYIEGDILGM